MTAPILIAGSGLAAFAVAREFRKLDRDTPITLVTREDGYFYSKPMLSTALANGKSPDQLVTTARDAIATQLNLNILANTAITAIDAAAHQVATDQGVIHYSKLVLALGADPIRLPLTGNAADRVLSVNDLGDYAAFRDRLRAGHRVTILGAGLIGCEFANDLVAAGHEVHLIDLAPTPLGRLLPQAAGKRMHEGLSRAGIHLHLGTTVASIDYLDQLSAGSSGTAMRITLANGQIITTDLVLSAIGLKPRVALAESAGLQVNRGISVNRYLEASVADIYALGDCAEVEGLVLPYVMPIMAAGRALAATLAGQRTAVTYPVMPVVVKTPAMPAVVCPPSADAVGQWQIDANDEGLIARFDDAKGQPLGFALLGAAVNQKNALAKLVPPVLV